MREDLVILYSGGADSRLLLELALKLEKVPFCILIDYEQLHQEELSFAHSQLKKLNIEYQIIKIKDLNINSGLTGNGNKNNSGEVHEMHVPGRNTMFLSLAFSIAETKNIDTIWIGSDWSDRLNLFPDCYQEYIFQINKLFEIAGPKPIKVEGPLLGMTKELVLNLLKSYGIDEKELFSGYMR